MFIYLHDCVGCACEWANEHTLIGPGRSSIPPSVLLLCAFLTVVCLWFEIILIWNFTADHNVSMAAKKCLVRMYHWQLLFFHYVACRAILAKGKLQHTLFRGTRSLPIWCTRNYIYSSSFAWNEFHNTKTQVAKLFHPLEFACDCHFVGVLGEFGKVMLTLDGLCHQCVCVPTHNTHFWKIMQIRINKMALCSQFNALHLYHSNEKWRRQQKKVADSNNDNTKNLCRTRDKVEVRFLVIWFANANSLPFDAYGFNLYVLFCSSYISHGHRYHYTNTQLCKCGEMEMIVSLLWFDLSALFSLLEKQRHISSKRNKRIILTLFFKRWISNSSIAHANP